MTQITLEHADAVSSSTSSCLLQAEGNCSPVFKRLMRKRAILLTEVQEIINSLVASPELPLDGAFELKDKPEPERPQNNGTAAKSNQH